MTFQFMPIELISLILYFLGPYNQLQFTRTCHQFHDSIKWNPGLLDSRGHLRVWAVFEQWKMEESGSVMDLELRALLMEQPSVKFYARFIFNGAHPDFDPYECFRSSFKKTALRSLTPVLSLFIVFEPVSNLQKIDPEVIAILVSIYPKEMLATYYYSTKNPHYGNICNSFLLYKYGSQRRAKVLLKVVASHRKFSLQHIAKLKLSFKCLRPETISTVIANSETDQIWNSHLLEDLIPYINSPKLMKLFIKVSPAQIMIISPQFLEAILKLGVSTTQINRCRFRYHFDDGEELTESFMQILLHCGLDDESFVIRFMYEYFRKTKLVRWRDEDDQMATDLGYSRHFRDRMMELVLRSSMNH